MKAIKNVYFEELQNCSIQIILMSIPQSFQILIDPFNKVEHNYIKTEEQKVENLVYNTSNSSNVFFNNIEDLVSLTTVAKLKYHNNRE